MCLKYVLLTAMNTYFVYVYSNQYKQKLLISLSKKCSIYIVILKDVWLKCVYNNKNKTVIKDRYLFLLVTSFKWLRHILDPPSFLFDKYTECQRVWSAL